MEKSDSQISQNEIYLKLGKLEGLMETLSSNVSGFQMSLKDIHARIDVIETRQTIMENSISSSKGAANGIVSLARDFAIPILAIVIAWMVGKDSISISRPTEINHEKGKIERSYHSQ
jgi:hypothetical protein